MTHIIGTINKTPNFRLKSNRKTIFAEFVELTAKIEGELSSKGEFVLVPFDFLKIKNMSEWLAFYSKSQADKLKGCRTSGRKPLPDDQIKPESKRRRDRRKNNRKR